MNKWLVITIDVEPDCTTSWRYSDPVSFKGVREGIAKRLQPLFNEYNLYPTYLINNVVLEDDDSCRVLGSLEGRHELGTHLHPEFIEPEKAFMDYAGKKGEANCCFYPPQIESAKIETITNLFRSRFGYAPKCFRAGRFSAGANTIASLARLNYEVDTSVTPHVLWDDKTREKPVDFINAREQPYFIKDGSILEEDQKGKILQVPVTISTKKASWFSEIKRTRLGFKASIQHQRPLWLRPAYSSTQELVSLTDEYLQRYCSNQNVVLNMMFHNVEVMPSLSPYTKTEADCKRYMKQLSDFFSYCSSNDIRGATLSDVYQLYRK